MVTSFEDVAPSYASARDKIATLERNAVARAAELRRLHAENAELRASRRTARVLLVLAVLLLLAVSCQTGGEPGAEDRSNPAPGSSSPATGESSQGLTSLRHAGNDTAVIHSTTCGSTCV